MIVYGPSRAGNQETKASNHPVPGDLRALARYLRTLARHANTAPFASGFLTQSLSCKGSDKVVQLRPQLNSDDIIHIQHGEHLLSQAPRLSTQTGRDAGPVSFADIIATAAATGRVHESSDAERSPDQVAPPVDSPPLRPWLLHETQSLRQPVYRTEARDRARDDGNAVSDPHQLPLLHYDYGTGMVVLSQMGELTARDLRVMSVVSQVFFENRCPDDNTIYGDEATLGLICRQLGLNPSGYVNLVKASVERLATSKVVWQISNTILDEHGVSTGTDQGEVAVGFITNWGSRKKDVKGQPSIKNNFIILDPIMAQMIRSRRFTWLRADTIRRLSNHALATKLYAFMKTHRPNDREEIEYGVMNLAKKFGGSDQKRSRVRAKLQAAAAAICKEAPDEFPQWRLRTGVRDDVLVLKKTRQTIEPALSPAPAARAWPMLTQAGRGAGDGRVPTHRRGTSNVPSAAASQRGW